MRLQSILRERKFTAHRPDQNTGTFRGELKMKKRKLITHIRAFETPIAKIQLYKLDIAIEKGLKTKKVGTDNEPSWAESKAPIYKIDGKYYIVTVEKRAILSEILNPEIFGLSDNAQNTIHTLHDQNAPCQSTKQKDE